MCMDIQDDGQLLIQGLWSTVGFGWTVLFAGPASILTPCLLDLEEHKIGNGMRELGGNWQNIRIGLVAVLVSHIPHFDWGAVRSSPAVMRNQCHYYNRYTLILNG